MKQNCHLETPAPAESTAVNLESNHSKQWWMVRPVLLVTLAVLLGVLGVVIACPVVVDQTVAVIL